MSYGASEFVIGAAHQASACVQFRRYCQQYL